MTEIQFLGYTIGKANIKVFTPHGTVYSRGENFTETRFYSDPSFTQWTKLTKEHRRDFINRTDRAVFSQQAQQVLNDAKNITYQPGKVVAVRREQVPAWGAKLVVSAKYPPNSTNSVDLFQFDQVVYALSLQPISMLLAILDLNTLRHLPLCQDQVAVKRLLLDALGNEHLGRQLSEAGVLDWGALDQVAVKSLLETNPKIKDMLAELEQISNAQTAEKLIKDNPAIYAIFEDYGIINSNIINFDAFSALL